MSVRLDASGDHLYRTGDQTCPSVRFFAVSGWYCRVNTRVGQFPYLFGTGAGEGFRFGIYMAQDDNVFKAYDTGGYNGELSASGTGTWWHIYFRYSYNGSAADNAYGYCTTNGDYTGKTVTGTLTYILGTTDNDDLRIGASDSASTNWTDCQLRAWKFWSAADDAGLPSVATLQSNYAQLAPITETNLWAYYKFTDASTALTDYSGNGRTLSTAGTLTDGSSDPSGIPEGGVSRNPVPMGFVLE